ncbi:putative membrane protein [Pectobacterium atrosepticum SCRI1043]|uniref:Membrane protein n=1 Tax=Pectobacterium atrosepticum (strain SCRI 1043 / ATCC BAA-672) TaxID=218491 RepID=Q6DB59_PECAS|nr:putative membrane protein [Pectobacterium atrosepticum]POW25688.1 hypothetical protein PB72LOC_03382 [Pectobacterium atrosepticum]GKV87346.1 hypothetical protein PEC301296_36570 [Pectobacterium carotovorum subsp. carotovorum]CAG72963.1 putative membrane protein [Pectobacterium atrosepticum SCRI1043]
MKFIYVTMVDVDIPVILQAACVLASSLTPVTYLSKLLGTHCVAAFPQLELFMVYTAGTCAFLRIIHANVPSVALR